MTMAHFAPKVPALKNCKRHMCKAGCYGWQGPPGDPQHWHDIADHRCPVCDRPRFERDEESGALRPVRVFYLLSAADAIRAMFKNPEWAALRKTKIDISDNSFHASAEARRADRLTDGEFLALVNGLYTLTADGFQPHLTSTQSITGVGIRCEDLPSEHLIRKFNWQPLAIIGPGEPANLGMVITELLDELDALGEHGVEVSPRGQKSFRHKVFIAKWVADTQGRRKIFLRGGTSNKLGCPWCLLISGGPEAKACHPMGYVEPVLCVVEDEKGLLVEMYVKAGDDRLLVDSAMMQAQGEHVEKVVRAYLEAKGKGRKRKDGSRKDGVPFQRVTDAKQTTGSQGVCEVVKRLWYVSYENLFHIAPGHLFYHGLARDFWRAFLRDLALMGFKALKVEDKRQALLRVPSDVGRMPKIILPKSQDSQTDAVAMSGWIMEQVWHHAETFSLLTGAPLFNGSHLVGLVHGVDSMSLEARGALEKTTQDKLDKLRLMWLRLQGAAWYVLRGAVGKEVYAGATNEELAKANDAIREGWARLKADLTVFARMVEKMFGESECRPNLHSAVCRLLRQMAACGHPALELWMENLMGHLKKGAKRTSRNVEATMMADAIDFITVASARNHDAFQVDIAPDFSHQVCGVRLGHRTMECCASHFGGLRTITPHHCCLLSLLYNCVMQRCCIGVAMHVCILVRTCRIGNSLQ